MGASSSAFAATVVLNLFNTETLVDQNSVPLLGNSSSGDLVQLYTLGGNNMVDIPNSDDGSLTDDVLFGTTFNPTHVGAGTIGAGNDSGILLQVNIEFDDSLVGTEVYVRFWNDSSIEVANRYGVTPTLIIPSVSLGEANLDFAPLGTGPYITNIGFSYGVTPEPSSAVLILCGGLGFLGRRQLNKWTVRPQHHARLQRG